VMVSAHLVVGGAKALPMATVAPAFEARHRERLTDPSLSVDQVA